ncbi:MAG: hypothetical protein WD042_02690 [Phycisphaeraceae bacterium]
MGVRLVHPARILVIIGGFIQLGFAAVEISPRFQAVFESPVLDFVVPLFLVISGLGALWVQTRKANPKSRLIIMLACIAIVVWCVVKMVTLLAYNFMNPERAIEHAGMVLAVQALLAAASLVTMFSTHLLPVSRSQAGY